MPGVFKNKHVNEAFKPEITLWTRENWNAPMKRVRAIAKRTKRGKLRGVNEYEENTSSTSDKKDNKTKKPRMNVTVCLTFMSMANTYVNQCTNDHTQHWTKHLSLFRIE